MSNIQKRKKFVREKHLNMQKILSRLYRKWYNPDHSEVQISIKHIFHRIKIFFSESINTQFMIPSFAHLAANPVTFLHLFLGIVIQKTKSTNILICLEPLKIFLMGNTFFLAGGVGSTVVE
jgi:hypothetical protein